MTETEKNPPRLAVSLLLLRLGVAVVMLFWTADKFLNPNHTASVFSHFYGLDGIGSQVTLVIGGIEALVVLAFTIGLFRSFSYAAVLLMHSASTIASWRQYAEPLDNLLFLAAWPMLAACGTLFLLRRYDEFTIDQGFGIGTRTKQQGSSG